MTTNDPTPFRPTDPTPPTPPAGMALAKPCVSCGTEAGAAIRHEGKLIPARIDGMCIDCAERGDKARTQCATTCSECERQRPIKARGLCASCYFRNQRLGTLPTRWAITDPSGYPRCQACGKWGGKQDVYLFRLCPECHAEERAAMLPAPAFTTLKPYPDAHEWIERHPDLVTPEALAALFVGPVVERGHALWCRDTAQAA